MRTSLKFFFLACFSLLAWNHAAADPSTPPAASPATSAPPAVNLDSLSAPLAPESKFTPLAPPMGPAESAVDEQYAQAAAQRAKEKDEDNSLVAKAEKAQQDAQSKDANWLLNNYEEQMHNRSLKDKVDGGSADLYDSISSDKDLAKLAGLKSGTDTDPSKLDAKKTGDGDASTLDKSKTKDDADPSETKKKDRKPGDFIPLITPLSAPDAAGLKNFYSTLPSADGTGTGPSQLDKMANETGEESINSLSSTVDTPGLTAAGVAAGANEKAAPDNISLDMLPGESASDASKHQDTFTYSNAPATTAISQLQNQNIAQMALPVSMGRAPALPMSPLLTNPALDAKPLAAPAPAYYKPRVADPFDMLNR